MVKHWLLEAKWDSISFCEHEYVSYPQAYKQENTNNEEREGKHLTFLHLFYIIKYIISSTDVFSNDLNVALYRSVFSLSIIWLDLVMLRALCVCEWIAYRGIKQSLSHQIVAIGRYAWRGKIENVIKRRKFLSEVCWNLDWTIYNMVGNIFMAVCFFKFLPYTLSTCLVSDDLFSTFFSLPLNVLDTPGLHVFHSSKMRVAQLIVDFTSSPFLSPFQSSSSLHLVPYHSRQLSSMYFAEL